eukprot:TRINITY_DN33549_c0_g1_i1.p1 TRINITY_DN33549_c0_g1~~TRINITY_DN33549_c0_g1_i1.p1  ORF type:complete len:146 (-),score=53.69 TRINITY_DN33549_c0_g1_i1:20-457(-)
MMKSTLVVLLLGVVAVLSQSCSSNYNPQIRQGSGGSWTNNGNNYTIVDFSLTNESPCKLTRQPFAYNFYTSSGSPARFAQSWGVITSNGAAATSHLDADHIELYGGLASGNTVSAGVVVENLASLSLSGAHHAAFPTCEAPCRSG